MTNVLNVLTATKEEIRMELAKLGVELSNTKYAKTKRQELIDMLNNTVVAQQEIKLEGDVNMENNNQVSGLSFEGLLANIKEDQNLAMLVGKQVKVSEVKVKNHVSMTGGKVVAELSKKIDALEGTIKALVTNVAKTVKYTEVVNPNQANVQYNKAAAKLQPIDYVINDKTGAKEAYFGICSVCGCKIKSAKVVEFSKSRFGKVMCYAHQNGTGAYVSPDKQERNRYESACVENAQEVEQHEAQKAANKTVTHKCMYCGKDVTFKSQEVLDGIMAKAKARGLAPIAHPCCYKTAMDTKENVEQYMAEQQQLKSESNISEEATNVINDMFKNQESIQPESQLDGNAVWTSVPVTEDDDNHQPF